MMIMMGRLIRRKKRRRTRIRRKRRYKVLEGGYSA